VHRILRLQHRPDISGWLENVFLKALSNDLVRCFEIVRSSFGCIIAGVSIVLNLLLLMLLMR
jgi:hypothetical protein